jgi:SAM-dependent methyltransferase
MSSARVPIYVPEWLFRILHKVRHPLPAARNGSEHTKPDIYGDRDVEWAFIASQMTQGPGEALDFGCFDGNMSLLAAQCGFRVIGLDQQPQPNFWHHKDVHFVQGDLLVVDLPENHFDLIINCSTVEHVGLVGRYGVMKDSSDGDLQAMRRMLALLRPQGTMLLTTPCGKDGVFAPLHRVYGPQRLPLLLAGYCIDKEAYWIKGSDNCWKQCTKAQALAFEPSADYKNVKNCSYGLACLVLRKPNNPEA